MIRQGKNWDKIHEVIGKSKGNELLAQLCIFALSLPVEIEIAMVWWAYYHINDNQWIDDRSTGRVYLLPGPAFSVAKLALEYAIKHLKWTEMMEDAPWSRGDESDLVEGYRHEGDGIVCFSCRNYGGNCGGGAVYSLLYTEDGFRFVYVYDH